MLWGAYAKIKEIEPVMAIDVDNYLQKGNQDGLSRDGQVQQEMARRFTEDEKKQIEKKLKDDKKALAKEQERVKDYYVTNKAEIRKKQAQYYSEKVDKNERNRQRALAKLEAGLDVKERTIKKYNIKPSEYK
jgi:hypothetical protein